MAAGKARRRRSSHPEPRVACLGWANAPEKALDALIDEQALGADQCRHGQRLTPLRRVDDGPTNADDMPDSAEVADEAGRVEHGGGKRVAAQAFELLVAPRVE